MTRPISEKENLAKEIARLDQRLARAEEDVSDRDEAIEIALKEIARLRVVISYYDKALVGVGAMNEELKSNTSLSLYEEVSRIVSGKKKPSNLEIVLESLVFVMIIAWMVTILSSLLGAS